MAELTPDQAVTLADDVYALSRLDNIDRAIKYLNDGYDGQLTFHQSF